MPEAPGERQLRRGLRRFFRPSAATWHDLAMVRRIPGPHLSRRARVRHAVPWIVLGLLLQGCASPLAALPLMAAAKRTPQALSAPMEDGSMYVLVESPTASSPIKRLWKNEAKSACEGDYLVLSERQAQRKSSGVTSSRIYEGYVQCVSPEPTADVPENQGQPQFHNAS
jgi:hypothetical protein